MSKLSSRPTLLLQYTGILALGVGDAVVSVKGCSRGCIDMFATSGVCGRKAHWCTSMDTNDNENSRGDTSFYNIYCIICMVSAPCGVCRAFLGASDFMAVESWD